MNPVGFLFTVIVSIYLFTLPKNFAAIPLLVGALYMTRGQILDIGPAHFPVMRILVVVGAIRVIVKGEKISGGINRVDLYLILWGVWMLVSSAFHTSVTWPFRIGMVLTELGSYLLLRVFIKDADVVQNIFKILCVISIPIAILMIYEHITSKNCFAALGGVDPIAQFRKGQYRSEGPFNHPILAGTVGATFFSMGLYFLKSNPKFAFMGMFGGGGMVYAAASSGPIMMVLFTMLALALWKVEKYMSNIRWIMIILIVILNSIMKDPVYFLMARIDIAGGSTGWHRARLIQSSIEHLSEWWFSGTDYTRHWMPTGIPANDIHTDITNHLLANGVMGGLPIMIFMIMAILYAFNLVGRTLRENENASIQQRFLVWALGAILFGHLMNFFSIVLYDQSVIFFYLILACIGGASHFNKQFTKIDTKLTSKRFAKSRYVHVDKINKKFDRKHISLAV